MQNKAENLPVIDVLQTAWGEGIRSTSDVRNKGTTGRYNHTLVSEVVLWGRTHR